MSANRQAKWYDDKQPQKSHFMLYLEIKVNCGQLFFSQHVFLTETWFERINSCTGLIGKIFLKLQQENLVTLKDKIGL